jgi:hypothetical protein
MSEAECPRKPYHAPTLLGPFHRVEIVELLRATIPEGQVASVINHLERAAEADPRASVSPGSRPALEPPLQRDQLELVDNPVARAESKQPTAAEGLSSRAGAPEGKPTKIESGRAA